MKPKNKFQQQIVEASKTLPSITQQQIQWGYDNAIEYAGRRTEKGIITCTKCGHSWQGAGHLVSVLTDCTCPNCKSKLAVETTKKRVFNGKYYMTVITTHKGFQVVRSVMLSCTAKIGKQTKRFHSEVMQRWIAPNGKYATLAILRQTMGTCYYDSWIFNTPLELRNENSNNQYCMNVYDKIYTGVIYPRQKLIPELKRTGYKKALYGQKPLDLFRILLTDSRAETLLKTGQTKLLKRLLDMGWQTHINQYWASACICNRNGYKIKDATLWCDYIDQLYFFRKDLHNAKYVCPTDLHAEHNQYMKKKAKADAQAELEKQLEKEAEYRKAKEKFFGIMFSDGLISVRVLESIAEIVLEGKMMHHCVGSYHSKTDSLILSACIDGERIETVEISLSQLRVIQCRGVCNKNTEHHDRIINLVNNNISLIEKRLAA
jgi:ribosomal protein L37AE/L43A